ncbi:MAG: hypothetical protein AB8G95_12615 [Anaerolineae bacterium]
MSQTETSSAFYEQKQNDQQTCGGLNQEAENATLFGGMQIGSDGNASGGKYIYVPSSYGEEIYEVKPENRAELCVNIQSAGTYRIIGRVQGSNSNSDSLYVFVDGAISNSYLWDIPENSQFLNDEISNRGVSNPQIFNFTAGQHTLTFVHREPNTKLDKIEFIQVSVATPNPQVPTSTPFPPTVTATQTLPTATPINQQPTATTVPTQQPPTQIAPTATTNSGGGAAVCGGLIQEAENGTLFGQMTTGFSTSASNGQFIYVPDNVSGTGSLNKANRADFCVNVQVAGEYKINTWVHARNITTDSFFVTIDDLPAAGYLWDVAKSNDFTTDFVNDRRKANPQIVYLSAGQHTLAFHHRESGTLLDKFELVLHASSGGNPPPTAVPPTATETPPIQATSTSAPPTATPTTILPTATPNGGQGSGVCGGLAQEAEQGTLFGDMAIGNDNSASGGRYIYIPNSFTDRGNFDAKDRADFCVNVQVTGEYALQAWVKAPNIYSDSFFITVDGLPSGGYLWDARKSSNFVSDFVSNRSKADPQIVYLSAGQHTVSFVQRETGTLLDKFELVLSSRNGAPIPTNPAPTSIPPTSLPPTPTATVGVPVPTATPISNNGNAYFVSRNGSNGDGRSWASAWNELNQINWSVLQPGDTVFLDGGSNSMTYRTTLKPAKSGTNNDPILIQLSSENGRDGQAIFFGGNSVLLPECGQRSWNQSEWNNAGDNSILFEKGVSYVTVDGRKRQGIVIHGWKADGVKFVSDRINNGRDDNTKNITLRYMEIYNNGNIRRQSDGSSSNLYYPDHASSGIEISGVGHKFEFMEIHDNASDAIQSGYTNPSGGVYNNMDDFTLTDSWLYNMRPHSGQDNSPSGETCTLSNQSGCDELGAPNMARDYQYYPASPSNRTESFNWCTHSDGIQIFSSNDFNTLTVKRTIIGPNFMTGMILGDRNGTNTSAWINNLTLEDVVITRFMHNALGMKSPANNPGKNWNLKNVTIYGHYSNTNKGSLSMYSNTSSPEHSVEDSIMVFGRTSFPDGNVTFRNNCDYNLYSGSLNGAQVNPQFSNILNRDVFESNINVDFANVFTDNYTAGASQCSGSRMTSTSDLLSRFNRN